MPSLPAGAAAPSAEEWQSFREAAQARGLNLGHLPSDEAAIDHVLLALRQAQQAQQLAQRYQQHAPRFEQWLAQQAQEEQRRQEEQRQWWKAPEWNPEWRHLVARDNNGNLVPVAGASPEVVQKFQQYQDWRRETETRFWQDPLSVLRPGLEPLMRQLAQEMVAQHLGQHQQNQTALSIVRSNPWIGTFDANGQIHLTEEGHAYRGYVERYTRQGITDPQTLHDLAAGLVQRDLLIKQAGHAGQAATAVTQGEAAKQQFLQQAVGGGVNRPNAGGSLPNPGNPGQQPAQNSALPLAQRMANAFAAAGKAPHDQLT